MRALAVVVLLLLSCRPRDFDDADRRAIETVLTEQAAAWNSGDLFGFMAAY